ncbi:MAG: hypothetical protein L0Y79_00820 [Chlorobi bacterium]|nr:hypothetical protein [Chlorobiota bacterium]MCI0715502.1 hypothetical protein [Chlorobiota bacterium]
MKTLKLAAVFTLSFVFIYAFAGCGKKESTEKQNEQKQTDQTKADTTKMVKDGKYVCPMHPLEQSNEPAKCRICKMNLVPKDEHNKEMMEMHEKMEGKYAGKKDMVHFEVKLSVIKSDRCEGAIESALSSDKGIVDYHIDIIDRVIHMYFDKSKTSKDNIEKLVSNAGFDANERKANPDAVAKLPDECK